AAVKEMIRDRIEGMQAAGEGQKPAIIHLAGPLGSNQLLRGMADSQEGQPAIGKELKEALDHSVQSDFGTYKAQLSAKLLDGQPVEPYAKWRGLLSGVDQAVQKMAEDKKLNQVVDNTWALSNEEV